MPMIRRLAALMCASMVLGVAVPASAQTARDVVETVLAEAGKVFKAEGFTKSGPDVIAEQAQGKSGRHQVKLTGERVYSFSAVCDTDCSDIDLTLYDSNGRVVDADTDDSDSAVIAVPIESSGTYTLELLMAKCSEAPCVYGITTWHLIP